MRSFQCLTMFVCLSVCLSASLFFFLFRSILASLWLVKQYQQISPKILNFKWERIDFDFFDFFTNFHHHHPEGHNKTISVAPNMHMDDSYALGVKYMTKMKDINRVLVGWGKHPRIFRGLMAILTKLTSGSYTIFIFHSRDLKLIWRYPLPF